MSLAEILYKLQLGFGPVSKQSKIVVYTCVFGGYEAVQDPVVLDDNVQYILFTDNSKLKSDKWIVNIQDGGCGSPRRASRYPKIMPHQCLPEHDVSIYIDGSLRLKAKNIRRMANNCLQGRDIALYKHFKRKCTYDEGAYCVSIGKEREDVVARQLGRYQQEGFPKSFGLFENAFIVRRNVKIIHTLNELWWKEYSDGSQRDQLSLMYCLWKLGVDASRIPGKQFRKSRYATFRKHSYINYLEN